MKTLILAIFITMPIFIDVAWASEATCQMDQLTAAATLCKKVLLCESSYSKNSAKNLSLYNRDNCISKAESNFSKSYSASLAKEQRKGGQCALNDDVATIAGDWSGAINGPGSLSDFIRSGWNQADAQSNKLYAALLSASATSCSTTLNAYKAHTKKPDMGKLLASLEKIRNKFLFATQNRIAKLEAGGFLYEGHETTVLANQIKNFSDTIVTRVSGNASGSGNTPGSNGNNTGGGGNTTGGSQNEITQIISLLSEKFYWNPITNGAARLLHLQGQCVQNYCIGGSQNWVYYPDYRGWQGTDNLSYSLIWTIAARNGRYDLIFQFPSGKQEVWELTSADNGALFFNSSDPFVSSSFAIIVCGTYSVQYVPQILNAALCGS